MIYIDTHSHDAAFNFAFEEYCMENILEDQKIISIWQADNCVMLGRYQIAQREIKEQYCKILKPKIIRRSSGGGTIYTDTGTLLFTVISKIKDFSEREFSNVCAPFVEALNRMGVNAVFQGRNDILIGDKKISGNAQTVKKDCLCSHGSLLYSTDLEVLSNILQADEAEIKSKAISSIRSRVTNIAEYMDAPHSVDVFRTRLKNALCEQDEGQWNEYTLTETDIQKINRIKTAKYDTWEWNYGNTPFFSYQNENDTQWAKL